MSTKAASKAEQVRVLLGVLEAVHGDRPMSQRRVAAELGIALGLVNAYVKRCVRKGLLKVGEVPARRYAYYLTPEGLAEKSRLTAEYLSYSFSFFREARSDCATQLARARAAGWRSIAIAGVSDIAEIAALCAIEAGMEIVCVVDACGSLRQFVGRPVVSGFDGVAITADCVIVTATADLDRIFFEASANFGLERVMVPGLLAKRLKPLEGAINV